MKRVILIPVYNDWRAVRIVVEALDSVLLSNNLEADVLLVDDCSTEAATYTDEFNGLKAIGSVQILVLRRNLGHQRAVAVGLAYVAEKIGCDELVLMDCDGEDKPEDVPRLLAELANSPIPRVVFAERTRRSENFQFCLGYSCYKALHHILTGVRVRFGNFSAMPGIILRKVVAVSEIWNHYVAGIIVARLPYTSIPTNRGKRVDGKSHMSFQALVLHGLRALSVFSDTISLQVLIWLGVLSTVAVCAIAVLLGIRLGTTIAIPGWTSTLIGILVIVLTQAFTLTMLFLFTVLSSRSMLGMIPIRDYLYFVLELVPVYERRTEPPLKAEAQSFQPPAENSLPGHLPAGNVR